MITLADVQAARRTIRDHTWTTPLVPSPALGERARAAVHLKLECWQRTGSFKIRGALARLASLGASERSRGLVTASAGNHALGVAYAAQALGIPNVCIFVPHSAPAAKVNRLSRYHCQIRRAGADYDTAHALAEEFAREQGALYVSAYDDPIVVTGQATVGLEILEAAPGTGAILVPVGGGGLIAGIALVARATNPAIRIIGVQPEASPSAYLSLKDGRPHETYPAGPTICDGLAGGFGRVPFELAAHLLDQVVVVPEYSVRHAVAWLVDHEQIVAEGSAAIAIAPLLTGQLDLAGLTAVAVLTGRNLDASLLRELLGEWRPDNP